MLALAAAILALSSVAVAASGNVRIHEYPSGIGATGNDPHVCQFTFLYANLTPYQSGDWAIYNGAAFDTVALSGTFAADANGDFESAPITTLANDHYKLESAVLGVSYNKTFWVDCSTAPSPPASQEESAPASQEESAPASQEESAPASQEESAPASQEQESSSPGESQFESFQGETAPPSGTSDGPMGGNTPLYALLISGLFGGLGLTAAQYQRRAVRR
jgi:hypothetical protein